ncbi:MAG: LPS export ABC transporter permease LptG [Candidatus Omnitrophica bacterium]|nr:LPS export ABC transporter permease LptG [Candidatus Omnitrophota bacterium]
MKIIDRYIAKSFLSSFLWCLFVFVIMAVIIDIFSFIDDIVKYKIPLGSVIAFYFYYIPTIFIQIIPMAALLSTIYVLSNLNKNNEIIAMKSSGVGLWRILTPLLVLGFLISVFTFMVNDRVIPLTSKVSQMIRREELEKYKASDKELKVIENVAVYGTGNRIVFARSYDTVEKKLSDIIIHEHDAKERLVLKTTANSAIWTGSEWKFIKVITYKVDNAGKILGSPVFYNEKIIPLKERPRDFANKELKAEFMSYQELHNYIDNFRGSGMKITRNLLVDLNYKLAFPFISLIIIMVAAPFALLTMRGGVMIGIGTSIVIGLLYYAVIAISLAFGKAGILPPILAAWSGNIIFTGAGIYLLNKRV